MHEPARVAHAFVARRRETVGAGNVKRPARVGAVVLALRDMAAVAGGHVRFAVLAPEPLARVAGQHVLRILRADLHAAVACAGLANHERRAKVALGDVELAAADERLQAADRLLVERVDAVHRVAQRLERDARELPAAHIQHG